MKNKLIIGLIVISLTLIAGYFICIENYSKRLNKVNDDYSKLSKDYITLQNRYDDLSKSYNDVSKSYDSLLIIKTKHDLSDCNIVDSLYSEIMILNTKIERIKYYNDIAKNGENIKYLRGWINRVLE